MNRDVYLVPVPAGALRDVWLRDPTVPVVVTPVIEARDDKPARSSLKPSRKPEEIAARTLYLDLLNRYGPVNGQRIYRRMQAEAKGPFKPGAKHHDAHVAWAGSAGVEPIGGKPKVKRPSPSRPRGGPRRGRS